MVGGREPEEEEIIRWVRRAVRVGTWEPKADWPQDGRADSGAPPARAKWRAEQVGRDWPKSP